MAKNFLKAKGEDFVEKVLGVDYQREDLLALVPGARAVPQIFKGDTLIGGYPELTKAYA